MAYGVDSGGMQVSRWGIRGKQELSGSNTLNFALESGYNANSGTQSVPGSLFNRQAYLGISNQSWGEFRLGQQNSIMFNLLGNLAAFYGGSYAAGMGTESGYNVRNSNDIMYSTPRFAGWRGEFHWSLSNDASSFLHGTTRQAAIEYQKSRTYFLAAYLESRPSLNSPATYSNIVDRQLAIGGSYDINPFKIYAGYFRNKQSDRKINKDLYSVSGTYFIGPADEVGVGYTYISVAADAANTDAATFSGKGHANHFGIMYLHLLSKRTTVYMSYAYLMNSSGLRYALGAAQPPSGALLNRPDSGIATQGLMLGIRHLF